jgi:hypothetical protein
MNSLHWVYCRAKYWPDGVEIPLIELQPIKGRLPSICVDGGRVSSPFFDTARQCSVVNPFMEPFVFFLQDFRPNVCCLSKFQANCGLPWEEMAPPEKHVCVVSPTDIATLVCTLIS